MRKHEPLDKILLVVVAIILLIGLLTVFSAGRVAQGESIFIRQIIWLAIGIIIMMIGIYVDLKVLDELSVIIFIISCALLFLTLIFGAGPAGRWLFIGPLRFQPSEFAKVAMVLMAAHVLSSKKQYSGGLSDIRSFIWALPVILLTWLEPDLGTASAMIFILLFLLHWVGHSFRWIFLLLSPVLAAISSISLTLWVPFTLVLAAVLMSRRAKPLQWLIIFGGNSLVAALTPYAWGLLKPYQQTRLSTFLNPASDPHGAGWNVLQSQVAVGSGGGVGQGFLQGTQKELAFLPARHTDFVFSVWAEEFGFLGSVILLLAFSVLVWRMLVLAKISVSRFRSTLAAGVAVYFAVQVFVNVGMTIGVMPVTGLPLLLISYGGSHIVASMFLIGLVLNVSRTWREF